MTKSNVSRRDLLKTCLLGSLFAYPSSLLARSSGKPKSLQVWSCGGLAEGLQAAHQAYEQETAVHISYTGANAGALGRTLLGGAKTDLFAGRTLTLAQKLKQNNKLLYYKPFCFTQYVIIVPKGNPANIRNIEDLAKPEVRVVVAEGSLSPGGQAVTKLLQNAGIDQAVLAKAIHNGDCAQRVAKLVAERKSDAMVVEKRIFHLSRYQNLFEYIPISATLFPPGPIPFTMGVLADCENIPTAEAYLSWILGPQGERFMENAGFIHARSAKGKELTEKLGIK